MKTRDAFAFRDFDSEHILWRYFHDYLSDDGFIDACYESELSIEECHGNIFLLDFLQARAFRSVDKAQYGWAQYISNRLQNVCREVEVCDANKKIRRHISRLEKVNQRLSDLFFSAEDVPLESTRRKMRRAKELLETYTAALSATEDLIQRIKDVIDSIEFQLNGQFTNTFSSRLREARKAAGLTQSQVADKLGMSQGGYTQYEQQRREPSLATLAKLSKILKRPTDWLLGLS